MERYVADITSHLRETLLLSENEELDQALLHIEDLTVELERIALLSKEVLHEDRVNHNAAEAAVDSDDIVPADWIPPNDAYQFDSDDTMLYPDSDRE